MMESLTFKLAAWGTSDSEEESEDDSYCSEELDELESDSCFLDSDSDSDDELLTTSI